MENCYPVGSLVRIVRPEVYAERTGANVDAKCALDYFSDQICTVIEIKQNRMKLSLLNEEFENDNPKYKNDPGFCISDYVWNIHSVDLVEDRMTENEYDNVLFGA